MNVELKFEVQVVDASVDPDGHRDPETGDRLNLTLAEAVGRDIALYQGGDISLEQLFEGLGGVVEVHLAEVVIPHTQEVKE